MANCPHCGLPMIKADDMNLPLTKRKILEYIRRHPGSTLQQISDSVYGDLIDGGPETFNVVSVHISQMKATLAKHKIAIVNGRGRGATYTVVSL